MCIKPGPARPGSHPRQSGLGPADAGSFQTRGRVLSLGLARAEAGRGRRPAPLRAGGSPPAANGVAALCSGRGEAAWPLPGRSAARACPGAGGIGGSPGPRAAGTRRPSRGGGYFHGRCHPPRGRSPRAGGARGPQWERAALAAARGAVSLCGNDTRSRHVTRERSARTLAHKERGGTRAPALPPLPAPPRPQVSVPGPGPLLVAPGPSAPLGPRPLLPAPRGPLLTALGTGLERDGSWRARAAAWATPSPEQGVWNGHAVTPPSPDI